MPQPTLPPTPGPSTDIKAKQDDAVSDAAAFNLPPAAISSRQVRLSESDEKSHQHTRTPSSTAGPNDGCAQVSESHDQSKPVSRVLPPPPPRSRKIIQMKPKPRSQRNQESAKDISNSPSGSGGKTKTAVGASESKKKKANGTSSGRKIARKTAHSLIERRRRSKMNEEFGVLKDMIPACAGQDMHKLAILQASIDYVRYLKKCLEGMPENNDQAASPAHRSEPSDHGARPHFEGHDTLDGDSESDERLGEEMEVDSPSQDQYHRNPEQRTGNEVQSRYPNVLTPTSPPTSIKSVGQRPFSSASQCELPSPVFSAGFSYERAYGPCDHSSQHSQSTQTSPALLPQSRGSNSASDLDHEASTALLMLNARDRRDSAVSARIDRPRSASGTSGNRSISVKDLLRN